MDRNRFRRIALRTVAGVGLLLVFVALLIANEQRRSQAEMGAILSAFISDEMLKDSHDSPGGHEIHLVFRREARDPRGEQGRPSSPLFNQLFNQRSWFAQSSRTTRSSFFLSNVFSTDIQTELHLPRGVQALFVSRTELERMDQREFDTRFPNNTGYMVVSHAGLNLSRDEALLYIDHFCGGLCGGGGYVLMRKVGGAWHVVDEHDTWVS